MTRYLTVFLALTVVFFGGCTVKHGRIDLATKPPGADVYLDSIHIGKTPITFEHDSSTVSQMEIKLDGYYTINEVINWGWIHYELAQGNGTDRTKGEYQGKKQTIWLVTTRRTLLLKPKEKFE